MKATPVEVLYEDNHIIAVNKKPSDIVQGDKTGDKPLSDFVKDYIKEKYNKPGEVFLGTIHRIDRPVSGVVVFAKTSKALSRMNEMFKNREVQKTYWAVVKDKPAKAEDTLIHYLIKDEKRNTSKAFKEPKGKALHSELKYKVLLSSDNYHLLEINPVTGRHHQIRAQLSSIGCPIKGDVKYGSKRTNNDASIHLHARSISFEHPVKNEPLKIVAPPPTESLWNYFYNQLEEAIK